MGLENLTRRSETRRRCPLPMPIASCCFANSEQGASMLGTDMIEPVGTEWKTRDGATLVDHLDFNTGMSREWDRLAQLLSDEVIGHVWGHHEQN
jgi:hypothetical protein